MRKISWGPYFLALIFISVFLFESLLLAKAPDKEKAEDKDKPAAVAANVKKDPKAKDADKDKKKSKFTKGAAKDKQKVEEEILPVEVEEVTVPETLGDPFEEYFPKQEAPEPMVAVPDQFLGPLGGNQPVEPERSFDTSSLSVAGIVWGGDNPKAIINDKIYGKGDKVNDAEIIDISKDGILFKYFEKEYLLKRNMDSADSSGKGGDNEKEQQL